MHYQCLIVDDEETLALSTEEYFNLFDVKTKAVLSAQECLMFFKENTVDLILLDINLDGSSGFDLCRQLRQALQIPILFISARQSDDDILMALNIGGDDYIRKPYSLSVLLAKVKVMLKRFASPMKQNYISPSLTIDYSSGQVTCHGQIVRLKAMEYKLLCYLVQNKGRILTKEELFENVWKDSITSDGTLNVHIRHLREKIEKDPNQPLMIKTVWKRGYLFEESQ